MKPEVLDLYARRLGCKPVFLRALVALRGDERLWRISSVERGLCTLLGFGDDGALVERRARFGAEAVAVGDWVVLEDDRQDPARVARVLERMTWLQRGSAHREGEAQLIASNLDSVFIVAAFAETPKLEDRSLRARRLDRFISAVRQGGATPVVVLNKVDLAGRDEGELEALRSALAARLGGVDVVCASALDHRGLEVLSERLLPGDTVAFIGPSGVGKSSLINALLGEQRQVVSAVRSRDTKGRHTTTRRELLMLRTGALLVDTPGVREFAVVADEHIAGFEDIDELAQHCRFNDCAHDTEPGCVVRAAVERGELPAERIESHRVLERDAQRLRVKHDAYARHLEHSEQRRFGRLVREAMVRNKKT